MTPPLSLKMLFSIEQFYGEVVPFCMFEFEERLKREYAGYIPGSFKANMIDDRLVFDWKAGPQAHPCRITWEKVPEEWKLVLAKEVLG